MNKTCTIVRQTGGDGIPPIRTNVLLCGECGELFSYRSIESDTHYNLSTPTELDSDRPKFCPECGAKNKAKG